MQSYERDISWAKFETCNSNPQDAFEKMCRWLFNNFFFDGVGLLHSEHNNPGVEVVPTLCPKNNKRISFQAKYFSQLDYGQIEHSCEMAIKYYAGELDIIYLYCNKDVTTTSVGYNKFETLLQKNGMEIVPITNQAILEQVMKSESIAWYYFSQTPLTAELLCEKLKISLSSLGPRYNSDFNVRTKTESLFDYFLCNDAAVAEVNEKKNSFIKQLCDSRDRSRNWTTYANRVRSRIECIKDISCSNVMECLSWAEYVKEICSEEFAEISALIEEKKREWKAADEANNRDLSYRISEEIDNLAQLLLAPQRIAPDAHPQSLIRNQVLIVKGAAGVGKSQLFAVASENAIDTGKAVILLLGTNYLTNQTISFQTSEVLGVDIPLTGILHKLEGAAVQSNQYSYIFIDAINESTYKAIWRTGLTGLVAELKKYPHIKLALSVRSGYEKLVFDDYISQAISDSSIASIVHRGFAGESVKTTRTFLDFYGIPFLPSFYLQTEMANPLFLTLFCKTYSGANYDLFTLFDRVIEQAEKEALSASGLVDTDSVLRYLLEEIAEFRLTKGTSTISQVELFDLSFWNRVGLSSKKLPFISALARSGVMIASASEEVELYYFGYNLLEDFVCAKTIVRNYPSADQLISYICDTLLAIKDGTISNALNIDVFIVVCGLFAEKHNMEIFQDIAAKISDEYDLNDINERYILSFIWRKASSINVDAFATFLKEYPIDSRSVFRMLIENATKENHPLNANFLHELLFGRSLANRDFLWTTYINSFADEEERVFQLTLHFDVGNTLNGLSKANTELLLVLLTWLLTSSNHLLRDKASKAAIELLKNQFDLCTTLLKRFEGVNDPYVIQRLYGIVFGACVKRGTQAHETYRELAEYVLSTVFQQEMVYPDILLRDYARLILERWKYEFPDDAFSIDPQLKLIEPPYNSEVIPDVPREEYYQRKNLNSGFAEIDFSMRIDHPEAPGMYGDFGRYIFQSALENFDGVDTLNLYHYAMQFIRDELGYSDKLFETYDCRQRYHSYSRHDTRKIERIGKKYQWIAFYNILARVSDHHSVKDWGTESHPYEGPWEPAVRDFDPTLNRNLRSLVATPNLELPEPENLFIPTSPEPQNEDIQHWLSESNSLFSSPATHLMFRDEEGCDWCALCFGRDFENDQYNNAPHSAGFQNGSQRVWMEARAYFVKAEQSETLRSQVGLSSIKNQNFPNEMSSHALFSREYTWAPGYRSVFDTPWIDHEIVSGKYRVEKTVYEVPDFEHVEYGDEGKISIPYVKKELEKKVPEDSEYIQLAPTCLRFVWEEQYDASQNEATAFHIPCQVLTEGMNLAEKESDGFFYTQSGTLACFDGSLIGLCDCLLIRADILKQFLTEQNLCLFWICMGEKQYFKGDRAQDWSRWYGFLSFEDGEICGDMSISTDKG